MRLSLALWKGPNALQQDGRRTESEVSSSLQLLAWSISGPPSVLQQGLELLLLCCCWWVGGQCHRVSQCASRDLRGTISSSKRPLKSPLESNEWGGR